MWVGLNQLLAYSYKLCCIAMFLLKFTEFQKAQLLMHRIQL